MMGRTVRERIVEVLASTGPQHTQEICRRVKSTWHYVRKVLLDMEYKGLVQSSYRRLKMPFSRAAIVRIWWLTPKGYEFYKRIER